MCLMLKAWGKSHRPERFTSTIKISFDMQVANNKSIRKEGRLEKTGHFENLHKN